MPERGGYRPKADQEEAGDISRRHYLKMGAAGAAAGLAYVFLHRDDKPETLPGEEALNSPKEELPASPGKAMSVETPAAALPPEKEGSTFKICKTGPLANKKFGGLFSLYTGISGKVPPEVRIDFGAGLQRMWNHKNIICGNNPVVVETGKKLSGEYAAKGEEIHSLENYITEADKAIHEVNSHLDFENLVKIERIEKSRMDLVKQICFSFRGRDLIAYSLTELMPSTDGKLNAQVMEFLLQNAGSKFVEGIPALADSENSFGPYQFTPRALHDGGKEKKGASIPNAALPENLRLPSDVADLRGADHHKAAYLFVVQNVLDLVRHCKSDQLSTLNDRRNSKKDLLAYVATAHHNPRRALSFAKNWLSAKAKRPFKEWCAPAFKIYAEKTEANAAALYEMT